MVAAFEAMAELALAGAGDAAASPPPPELLVLVTPEELRASSEGVGAHASSCQKVGFAGRYGLSSATLRRLACDATTSTLLHGERGSPLDLGRRRRTISPHQRVALHVRADGHCEAPGCDRRRFLQGHHIWHWTDGGPTDMANLVLLCSEHHRQLHEGLYTIKVEGGITVFRAPGRSVMSAHTATADPALRCPLSQAPGTPTADWDGARLDLGLTIDAILSKESTARYRRERAAAAASSQPLAA